ncbi:hypothetical protein HID58_006453, partial [Brassica napus]
SGPFYCALFTLKRVCRAVALHRSRFQPDLLVKEGHSRAWMGSFRSPTDNILRDYLNSQAGGSGSDKVDLEEIFEFEFPPTDGDPSNAPKFTKASRMVNGGLLFMNRALKVSNQEACMAQFRAEILDKEIARLKGELECSRRHERGFALPEVRRAYRRGTIEMSEVMKNRCDTFSCEFGEFKESYQVLGDYRECRGTVGGLYLTQASDYSFAVENARQTKHMNERDRDFAIPQIEEWIWKQWEPIYVSPDTVEAERESPTRQAK